MMTSDQLRSISLDNDNLHGDDRKLPLKTASFVNTLMYLCVDCGTNI